MSPRPWQRLGSSMNSSLIPLSFGASLKLFRGSSSHLALILVQNLSSLFSSLLSLLFSFLCHLVTLLSFSRTRGQSQLSAFENRNSLGDTGVPALKRKIGGGY